MDFKLSSGTILVTKDYHSLFPSSNPMKISTDKEMYMMEEIDLYIRLLQKVQSENTPVLIVGRKENRVDRAIWYADYLQDRSEWSIRNDVMEERNPATSSGCIFPFSNIFWKYLGVANWGNAQQPTSINQMIFNCIAILNAVLVSVQDFETIFIFPTCNQKLRYV